MKTSKKILSVSILAIAILASCFITYAFPMLGSIPFLLCLGTAALLLLINRKSKREKAAPVTTESALQSLKAQFESGAITEEEYQARRTEIISKL